MESSPRRPGKVLKGDESAPSRNNLPSPAQPPNTGQISFYRQFAARSHQAPDRPIPSVSDARSVWVTGSFDGLALKREHTYSRPCLLRATCPSRSRLLCRPTKNKCQPLLNPDCLYETAQLGLNVRPV